jgi:hypothetical protein
MWIGLQQSKHAASQARQTEAMEKEEQRENRMEDFGRRRTEEKRMSGECGGLSLQRRGQESSSRVVV